MFAPLPPLHVQVGYPLVTVLVALLEADQYDKLVDSMADFHLKQLKVGRRQPHGVTWIDTRTVPSDTHLFKGAARARRSLAGCEPLLP